MASFSKTCACRNLVRCHAGEAGQLFLWFPVPHTLTKVVPYLKQAAIEFELMQERPGLSLTCQPVNQDRLKKLRVA
ncbi:hypothetical protein [Leptolyngbya sp. FACHB-711]|uniref:hypothetical protein n=1 Tax=unclassified Leptolyngbya TaxID=2650499 RepID=UPI0018F04625|nr:hypothetical protein [Leptolyngbya sp. FACHB-711]